MREYLTSDDICNSMSMQRTVFKGVFLVVEGVTDARMYGKFTDKAGVRVEAAHSKENVRGVVREMSSRRGDGLVIGIVDPDLERLRGKSVSPPMFYTDCRDMEMMAIRSNALDDVLDEYCDAEKLAEFTRRRGPVRDAVVKSSYPIGLLMHVSQRNGLGLSFKDLDFGGFIDKGTLDLDAGAMVSEVLANSRSVRVGRKEILKTLNDEARSLDDVWKAARGHDTVSILLIGLKSTFGGTNARGLGTGELGGALRLAFSDACFRETQLYRDTQEWSERAGVALWALNRRRSPRF